MVFLGQFLQALDLVDGRAEGGKGEPVPQPDIAEHDVADMQADAVADRREAGAPLAL